MQNPIRPGMRVTGFTYVPVPNRHVPKVMGLLVDLDATASTSLTSGGSDLDDDDAAPDMDYVGPDEEWSEQMLAQFAVITTVSGRNIGRAMTVLAQATVERRCRVWMTNTDLASRAEISVKGLTIAWSRLREHLARGGSGLPSTLPVTARTGALLPPPRGDSLHYSFRSVAQAHTWLEVTTSS